jgi:hypothetical protein
VQEYICIGTHKRFTEACSVHAAVCVAMLACSSCARALAWLLPAKDDEHRRCWHMMAMGSCETLINRD